MWPAALVAGALAAAAPDAPDDGFDAPLQLLYDGATDAALADFARLGEAFPADPLPVYFEALSLAWKLEQRPERRDDDARLLRLADLAIDRARSRLHREPLQVRALFGRGAAHGVKSRLHLFRRNKGAAAREAVAMREDLRRVVALEPGHEDARFGLALYDYYADVLPRMLKLLRALMGIPGGDRKRGLAGLRRAAQQAPWHGTEAQAQLYEIGAHYEHDPDAALVPARWLRERFAGSPLWGLRLGEHLALRLGLYAESVQVFEAVLESAERGHPNYAPGVALLAALGRAEALLLDLRFDAARASLAAISPEPGPSRARHVELAARLAALESDPAARAVAQARRLAEQGRCAEAASACQEVLRLRPRDLEAALCVAEADLRAGRGQAANAVLQRVAKLERPQPPSLGPRARLLLAELRERQGRRGEAVRLYKEVSVKPGGVEARRREAEESLRRLEGGSSPDSTPPTSSEHSR